MGMEEWNAKVNLSQSSMRKSESLNGIEPERSEEEGCLKQKSGPFYPFQLVGQPVMALSGSHFFSCPAPIPSHRIPSAWPLDWHSENESEGEIGIIGRHLRMSKYVS